MRPPRAGEDARVYAAREKRGRLVNSRKVKDLAAFYHDVETHYGAPDPR